jgi:hypothetical protein
MDVQGQKVLEGIAKSAVWLPLHRQRRQLHKNPRMPVAYWVSEAILATFVNGVKQ